MLVVRPLPRSGSSVLFPELVALLQARTFTLNFGFPGKLFGPGSSRGHSTLPAGLGMCVPPLLWNPMLAAFAHSRRYMPRFWEKSHAFHVPHVRRSVAYLSCSRSRNAVCRESGSDAQRLTPTREAVATILPVPIWEIQMSPRFAVPLPLRTFGHVFKSSMEESDSSKVSTFSAGGNMAAVPSTLRPVANGRVCIVGGPRGAPI